MQSLTNAAPITALPKTFVDLSMPIVSHWRFPVEFENSSNDAEGQQFFSTTLRIAAHAFTHVDSPRHVRADAVGLGDIDPGRLWGEAAVVDVSDVPPGAGIPVAALEAGGAHVQAGDIVLLRSNHEQRHPTTTPEYWTRAPYVSAPAARWLLERRVRAVGFDFPQDRATRSPYDDSFERHPDGHAEDWACHHLLLQEGIPQIEYLTNLDTLAAPRVLFFALPLNLPDGDGAPTRAFALVD